MRLSAEDKQELRSQYEALSPAERRNRVLLAPAFREAYNELTEAHRSVQVPRYFWVRWVPVLGPAATALYMQLRQYCFYNPATGELRNLCWPSQSSLGRAIGVRDVKTIRRALCLLERHGFIERAGTYRAAGRGRGPCRSTDRPGGCG